MKCKCTSTSHSRCTIFIKYINWLFNKSMCIEMLNISVHVLFNYSVIGGKDNPFHHLSEISPPFPSPPTGVCLLVCVGQGCASLSIRVCDLLMLSEQQKSSGFLWSACGVKYQHQTTLLSSTCKN